MTLWHQRNAAYQGVDGAITLEICHKDTATLAAEVDRDTIGHVTPSDGLILHHANHTHGMHSLHVCDMNDFVPKNTDCICDRQRMESGPQFFRKYTYIDTFFQQPPA
jgi:hypothetical protein